MKYMGSKARIAKHILPIVLKDRKEGQCYVEPFVGGANMIDKVDGWRIGADSNYWLIKGLELIRDCRIPIDNTEFNECHYRQAAEYARGKGIAPFRDELVGYALFAFSFGAKWIGGWSRGKNNKGEQRDYVAEQYKASMRQKPLLQGVTLINDSYDSLLIPPKSIIYCDPPYANTTKYKDDFDHDKFWQWCREKCAEGSKVFVSEYNAPDDFVCVWQQELNVSVAREGKQKKAIEKLFVHESQLSD